MAEMHHLDEGTIHAWLDGALPPDESARVEAHAAGCASCSAMVAEARGLIAASSRILSALDEVPAGVIPGAAQGDQLAAIRMRHRAMRVPWWRRRSVLAAASLLFVAGMTTVVQLRTPGVADLAPTQVTAESPSESNEPTVRAGTALGGSTRETLTVSPRRTESDQAAIAASSSAPPPSASGAPSPAARADHEAEAKRVPDSITRAREVATTLADSTGSVRDLAQKVEQKATNLALPGQSVAEARNQSVQGQGLAARQAGAAAERSRQALAPQAAPPVARTLPLSDSVARASAVMAAPSGLAPAFTGGCFALRGPDPVGGPLLGVPGLVRLLPGEAVPDTGWKPATSPEDAVVRTELAWRMIDAMTVELRVRRPLDSSLVVFRVVPAAPPLARAPAGMQVAAAERVVCR